jgi:hypothetical protein
MLSIHITPISWKNTKKTQRPTMRARGREDKIYMATIMAPTPMKTF